MRRYMMVVKMGDVLRKREDVSGQETAWGRPVDEVVGVLNRFACDRVMVYGVVV